MEKLFNPNDKEYMKMALLKHEETFREQVCELHRVYRIQKLLMKNISDRRNIKIVTKSYQTNVDDHHQDMHERLRKGLDLELPAEEYIPGTEENSGTAQIDDESELELTLGLGPKSSCRRRKSVETSLLSDSAASFSSSSTGSSNIKRTNAIEEELIGRKWGLELPGTSSPSVIGARKNISHVQEQLKQDRHSNSPWLLQALSLNMS
ncbi:hypothetical protein ACH5RR_013986 [Cinchona calisaya]|uniref:Uncharacterized protein n=1 Tax=Cinchona calisaya TaxID=153742 RepID=A0ABD3A1L2_9GENT